MSVKISVEKYLFLLEKVSVDLQDNVLRLTLKFSVLQRKTSNFSHMKIVQPPVEICQ